MSASDFNVQKIIHLRENSNLFKVRAAWCVLRGAESKKDWHLQNFCWQSIRQSINS